jgi:hypothetical protein
MGALATPASASAADTWPASGGLVFALDESETSATLDDGLAYSTLLCAQTFLENFQIGIRIPDWMVDSCPEALVTCAVEALIHGR